MGCQKKLFFSQSNSFAKEQPKEEAYIPPAAPEYVNDTLLAVRKIRPVLAVRGANCLMCHAQIESNMVSDFGNGEPHFMGGALFVDGAGGSNLWYSNFVNAWQTSTILGSLYVPKANATATSGGPYTPGISLAQYLTTPYTTVDNGWIDRWVGVGGRDTAASYGIRPPVAGQAPVVEMSQITIRAPSEGEILSLDPNIWPETVSFAEIRKPGSTKPRVSGISVMGTPGNEFIRNTGTFKCFGDVVINGALHLQDLQLETDDEGCRLYVTRTVFLYGPVTYVNESGSKNLQVTSSRAIIMGLGYDSPGMQRRLIDDNHNRKVRAANGIDTMNWLDMAAAIRTDARAVGTTNLKDANNFVGSGYPTAVSADGETRAAVAYRRVLLNAPTIDSRYLGDIYGIVITELAMFSVGRFVFKFDEAFTNVNILPLLTKNVLVVK